MCAYYDVGKKYFFVFLYCYFARLVGYSLLSFLCYVMCGERNFSLDSIECFVKVFGLDKEEGCFFNVLVEYE